MAKKTAKLKFKFRVLHGIHSQNVEDSQGIVRNVIYKKGDVFDTDQDLRKQNGEPPASPKFEMISGPPDEE